MGDLGSQLAPFCESSRAVLLERVPAGEMSVVVEVVMDRGVG